MKKLILFTFLTIMSLACSDDDSSSNQNDDSNIKGQYIGTFERDESISNIELKI